MAHAERTLNLPAHDENHKDPAVAEPLKATKKVFGMVPNMYARMANHPGLFTTYRTGYDAFRAGGLSPVEQEVVFLAISRFHGCGYCVAAHSAVADMVRIPGEVTEALRAGGPLPDPKLDALASFTRAMVERRGLPTAAELDAFLAAGYSETDVLAIVLAIATKTISNFTNHLFDTPIDGAFAHRRWDDPEAAEAEGAG